GLRLGRAAVSVVRSPDSYSVITYPACRTRTQSGSPAALRSGGENSVWPFPVGRPVAGRRSPSVGSNHEASAWPASLPVSMVTARAAATPRQASARGSPSSPNLFVVRDVPAQDDVAPADPHALLVPG